MWFSRALRIKPRGQNSHSLCSVKLVELTGTHCSVEKRREVLPTVIRHSSKIIGQIDNATCGE